MVSGALGSLQESGSRSRGVCSSPSSARRGALVCASVERSIPSGLAHPTNSRSDTPETKNGAPTRADLAAVREIGFDLVQGFLFGNPMIARKFARVLRLPPNVPT